MTTKDRLPGEGMTLEKKLAACVEQIELGLGQIAKNTESVLEWTLKAGDLLNEAHLKHKGKFEIWLKDNWPRRRERAYEAMRIAKYGDREELLELGSVKKSLTRVARCSGVEQCAEAYIEKEAESAGDDSEKKGGSSAFPSDGVENVRDADAPESVPSRWGPVEGSPEDFQLRLAAWIQEAKELLPILDAEQWTLIDAVIDESRPKPEPSDRSKKSTKRPTVTEIQAYALKYAGSREDWPVNGHFDAEAFFDHYSANGWKQSNGNLIKDWKAAVRQWGRRSFDRPGAGSNPRTFQQLKTQNSTSAVANWLGTQNEEDPQKYLDSIE